MAISLRSRGKRTFHLDLVTDSPGPGSYGASYSSFKVFPPDPAKSGTHRKGAAGRGLGRGKGRGAGGSRRMSDDTRARRSAASDLHHAARNTGFSTTKRFTDHQRVVDEAVPGPGAYDAKKADAPRSRGVTFDRAGHPAKLKARQTAWEDGGDADGATGGGGATPRHRPPRPTKVIGRFDWQTSDTPGPGAYELLPVPNMTPPTRLGLRKDVEGAIDPDIAAGALGHSAEGNWMYTEGQKERGAGRNRSRRATVVRSTFGFAETPGKAPAWSHYSNAQRLEERQRVTPRRRASVHGPEVPSTFGNDQRFATEDESTPGPGAYDFPSEFDKAASKPSHTPIRVAAADVAAATRLVFDEGGDIPVGDEEDDYSYDDGGGSDDGAGTGAGAGGGGARDGSGRRRRPQSARPRLSARARDGIGGVLSSYRRQRHMAGGRGLTANVEHLVKPRPHTLHFGGSSSERLTYVPTDSPGPGQYDPARRIDERNWRPEHAGPVVARMPAKGSFGHTKRFKEKEEHTMGPADYDVMGAIKRMDNTRGYTPPADMLHRRTNADVP